MDFALKNELDKILAGAIRNNWRLSKLRAELNRILTFYYADAKLRNRIISSVATGKSFQWLKENNMNASEKKKLDSIFNELTPEYAKQKAGINKDIIDIYKLALEKDLSKAGIKNEFEALNFKYNHYAETIVRTADAGVSSIKQLVNARVAGVDKFIYSGPSPERKLCQRLYGNIYSMSEINDISKSVGYDVFIWRGLWNCKHRWEVVLK